MESFLAGILTMGYLTSSVFFLKFWVRTKEALFAAFAAAFALLAGEQAILNILGVARGEKEWIYALPFAAFSLIIFAFLLKNRRRP
jgi:hypothetical protein